MKKSSIKFLLTATLSALIGVGIGLGISGTDAGRMIDERKAEVAGNLASKFIASQSEHDPNLKVKTVAKLHHIPIEVDRFQENIFRASGVANTFLIKTPEGNVLFDTGLPTQAVKHKRLLKEAAGGDIAYIVLSHSHGDHIGGLKFWQAEYPDAKVIVHERFAEGQRYLKDLEQYFWNRNRTLYTFMPEEPPKEGSMFAYGGITGDIVVEDGSTYEFELGGVQFQVIPTPGAEGDDNLVMWVPEQKALFTGDVFGPLFPMVPNLFTLRGERFRDPVAYINSLDTMVDLKPEIILPSHFDPLTDAAQLQSDLLKMREVTRYIHDATIAGMNAGKTLWQLMDEVQLPDEINISQGHGKVSWNVRSIWEYYSTWFHFESTTELYTTPVRQLYPELAELAGGTEPLMVKAEEQVSSNQPVKALHYIEMVLASEPNHKSAYQLRLQALKQLLAHAYENGSNFSETGWLKARIATTEKDIAAL